MKYLHVQPHDPLFFRDGMPFGMGEDLWIHSSVIPAPSVFWGAMFTTLYATGKVSLNDKDKLSIKAVYLYNHNTKQVYIPAPLDIFVDDKKKTYSQSFIQADSFIHNSSLPNFIAPIHDHEVEQAEGYFMPLTDLLRHYPFKDKYPYITLLDTSRSGGIENKVPHECSDLFRSGSDKKLYLEEYVFNSINKDEENGNLSKLGKWLSTNIFDKYDSYWKEKVAKDIVVLEDVDFRDFVTLTTEVITRTKIDNATGTVSDGALFTEEYLPAESVMYSLVMFAEEFSKDGNRLKAVKTNESDSSPNVLDFFSNGLVSMNNVLQIGGNVTLGKGIVRTKLLTEPVKSEENDKV